MYLSTQNQIDYDYRQRQRTERIKAERFIAETGCKKSVSLTMVTVSGIAHTGYWSEIHDSITSEDLFKA